MTKKIYRIAAGRMMNCLMAVMLEFTHEETVTVAGVGWSGIRAVNDMTEMLSVHGVTVSERFKIRGRDNESEGIQVTLKRVSSGAPG